MDSSAKLNSQKFGEARKYASLFLIYFFVALITGAILEVSGVLSRSELQTINKMFEARRWLVWTPESLNRLNPQVLYDYHEKHEIPRRWWAWDYTLSWMIEPNHIPVKHKWIIFNHLLEDEPPLEAIAEHPWMKPLMEYPTSRATLAKTVEFLARSGVKLIIMDNDFPQYTSEDALLAQAVHKCSTGEYGRKVPVYMVSTVNHRSFANVLQLDLPSAPVGIFHELTKIEPDSDVAEKYSGSTGMLLDEDQVVRRAATRIPGPDGQLRDSLMVKALHSLGEEAPANLPNEMDIDFAGPPNSELYPVRPFSYLLDPEQQNKLIHPPPGSTDVTLKDSVVILGDGVTDLYSTPYTNLGVNLMSGPEILAQAFDTISRKSWFYRIREPYGVLYLALSAAFGGAMLCLWRLIHSPLSTKSSAAVGLALNFIGSLLIVGLSIFLSFLLFSYARIIVPIMVPATALTFAALGTALWERENERIRSLRQELEHARENLEHAQENLLLQNDKHQAELRTQAAEARAQESIQDEQRRKEFVRRINHDLKGPVTVMSWTLSQLKNGGLKQEVVTEKILRLAKTCDRLIDLLHELARSYEHAAKGVQADIAPFQLNKVLNGCYNLAKPQAEMKSSTLDLSLPEEKLWVTANELKLARIIDNLVRNAILHNPPGTTIHLEARSRAHVHQIDISDNGVGIEADHLQNLFDPVYAAAHHSEGGEGLGLAIAKSFIESMGGKLSAKSEKGIGTTFTVSLPSTNLAAGGDQNEVSRESEILVGPLIGNPPKMTEPKMTELVQSESRD